MLTGIATDRHRLFLKGSDSSKLTVDGTERKFMSSDVLNKLSRSCGMASTDCNVSVLG